MSLVKKGGVSVFCKQLAIGRVAMSAKFELCKKMNEIAEAILKRARELTEHAGRKNITDSDIRLACSQITDVKFKEEVVEFEEARPEEGK